LEVPHEVVERSYPDLVDVGAAARYGTKAFNCGIFAGALAQPTVRVSQPLLLRGDRLTAFVSVPDAGLNVCVGKRLRLWGQVLHLDLPAAGQWLGAYRATNEPGFTLDRGSLEAATEFGAQYSCSFRFDALVGAGIFTKKAPS
jgi:hypothetical protein